MKKRILIASFKIGMGHAKAAAAIAEQFSEDEFEVKTVDLSDYSTIVAKEIYQKGYLRMTKSVPALYSFFYKQTYNHASNSGIKLRIFFDAINTTKFKQLVLDYQPDLIISTHFIVSNLVSHWKESLDLRFKLIFVMTDHEGHPLVIDKNIDLYAVPSETVLKQIKKLGAKNEICVTGIPIGSRFQKKYTKSVVLSEYGLDNKFTILLMSGGFGVGKFEKILQTLAGVNEDFQIMITAGQNPKLKKTLEEVASLSRKEIKVLGFTDKIPELMSASDIIVSKAGGLTVSESLAIGTPLLVFEPTPGQEVANLNFLTQNNAALAAKDIDDIARFIVLAINGIIDLSVLKKNIQKIAAPDAASLIKKEALRLLN